MSRFKTLREVETPDEGVVLVNGHYQANGTSDPTKASIFGDEIATVTYTSAGKWAGQLKSKPARCRGGWASVSTTADGVDLVAKLDWSNVTSTGAFTVRTLTGAVETNPPTGTNIAVFFVLKKTTRRARKR